MYTVIFGSVIYQTVGINFYWAVMLSIQLDMGRGISADPCESDILFPAEEPKFGADWIELSNTIDIEMDLIFAIALPREYISTRPYYCGCID